METLVRIANGESVLNVYNYGNNRKLDELDALEPTDAELNSQEFIEFLDGVINDADPAGSAA